MSSDNRPDSGEREYDEGYAAALGDALRILNGAVDDVNDLIHTDRPSSTEAGEGRLRLCPDCSGLRAGRCETCNESGLVTVRPDPSTASEGDGKSRCKVCGELPMDHTEERAKLCREEYHHADAAPTEREDSSDALAHTLESMAEWAEGGAVLREAARRLRGAAARERIHRHQAGKWVTLTGYLSTKCPEAEGEIGRNAGEVAIEIIERQREEIEALRTTRTEESDKIREHVRNIMLLGLDYMDRHDDELYRAVLTREQMEFVAAALEENDE